MTKAAHFYPTKLSNALADELVTQIAGQKNWREADEALGATSMLDVSGGRRGVALQCRRRGLEARVVDLSVNTRDDVCKRGFL